MVCGSAVCLRLGLIASGLATSALGQVPAFSLEAAAVNSRPIPGGPVSRVGVFPNDVVMMEIHIRDWSPSGQELSAYQAQMDPATYSSGRVGYIEPVDYERTQKTRESNKANSFIDEQHPEYVFAGLKTVPLSDTRSAGYRLASISREGGPLSPQDGAKFYCATVNLRVSPNAQGVFTIALMDGTESTTVRDKKGTPIVPVRREPLTIVVHPDIVALVAGLNGAEQVPKFAIDLNRNGKQGADDILHVIATANTGVLRGEEDRNR